ncbi:hypothetical protein N0V90_007110 [Kalmusia sp. IMI 367209]|nr:hypothetical protein N0V90_007110 [Kalmusia sp. IMI 367209]
MALPSRASSDAAPLLEDEFEIEEKQTESDTIFRRFSIESAITPFKFLLTVLKPSFLHSSPDSDPPKPRRSTAWLDGVRGIASFLVFIYHFQHLYHQAYNLGYASNGGTDDHWLIQLTIIRLIPNGQTQVATFYALSGVSLSLKPLQLARSHTWDKLFDCMFSSVFRRALRLYLPIFAVQSCVLLATLCGLFNHGFALSQKWPYYGTNELIFPVLDSKWEQIRHWLRGMWDFANPFAPNRPLYDVHLWTIPIEFRNSLILFVTLVGFSKLRPRFRISLTVLLWIYCVCVNEGETALFYAGMATAEFLLIQDENAELSISTETSASKWTILHRVCRGALWGALCFFGLHLLSWPPWKPESTPGFITLVRWTPRFISSAEYTWQRLGAAIFVFALAGSQQTASFVDPLTSITFQRFFGARTSFAFGIALPENPSTDFIGQISAPMPGGNGWAGISLTEDMEGPLLLAAWPNGNKVVSSFRIADNEDDSPPVVRGEFSVVEIPSGTVVNDTHMTFTFLCKGCIGDAKLGFTAQDTAGDFGMGWALADRAVSNPSDPAAVLPFHNSGFDDFTALLSQARSPLFGEWALLAGAQGAASNGSTTPIPVNPPGTSTEGGGADSDDEDDGGADSDDD